MERTLLESYTVALSRVHVEGYGPVMEEKYLFQPYGHANKVPYRRSGLSSITWFDPNSKVVLGKTWTDRNGKPARRPDRLPNEISYFRGKCFVSWLNDKGEIEYKAEAVDEIVCPHSGELVGFKLGDVISTKQVLRSEGVPDLPFDILRLEYMS